MSCDPVLLNEHHHAPIIGYHRAPLSQKFGAPRQPNLVGLTSVIEMIAPYDTPAAFVGLDAFSHIWISWQFHHNYVSKNTLTNKDTHINKDNYVNKDIHQKQEGQANHNSSAHQTDSRFRAQVRPPRLGGNQKIGVFASRSMYRPSALGFSVVKLEGVKIVQGRVLLIISGADMIEGTPIIDIKPYVAYSDALTMAKSGFAPHKPAPLAVSITESAHEQFVQIIADQAIYDQPNPHEEEELAQKNLTKPALMYRVQQQLQAADIDIIKALLAQDPRPAYRRTEIDTLFVMRYKSVDVSFQLIASGQLQISAIVVVIPDS